MMKLNELIDTLQRVAATCEDGTGEHCEVLMVLGDNKNAPAFTLASGELLASVDLPSMERGALEVFPHWEETLQLRLTRDEDMPDVSDN